MELDWSAPSSSAGGYMSRAALADARAAAQALPALITAERLTLGSSTSHELIHETGAADPLTAAITASPELTELAQALLDKIARPVGTLPPRGAA